MERSDCTLQSIEFILILLLWLNNRFLPFCSYFLIRSYFTFCLVFFDCCYWEYVRHYGSLLSSYIRTLNVILCLISTHYMHIYVHIYIVVYDIYIYPIEFEIIYIGCCTTSFLHKQCDISKMLYGYILYRLFIKQNVFLVRSFIILAVIFFFCFICFWWVLLFKRMCIRMIIEMCGKTEQRSNNES